MTGGNGCITSLVGQDITHPPTTPTNTATPKNTMERRKTKQVSSPPPHQPFETKNKKRFQKRRTFQNGWSRSSGRFPTKVVLFSILFVVAYQSSLGKMVVDVDSFSSPADGQNMNTNQLVLFGPIATPVTNGHVIVPKSYLPQRPRTFGFYLDADDNQHALGAERIDPNDIHHSRGRPRFTKRDARQQLALQNSEEYAAGLATELEDGNCVAQYEWQTSFYPTCNHLMEQDLTNLYRGGDNRQESYVQYLASGYWRDVWALQNEAHENTVVKTMRYEHDYTPRNLDRHRRDAVAMERLTASTNIIDIYAFCGNSGIFEFASGGNLEASAHRGQFRGRPKRSCLWHTKWLLESTRCIILKRMGYQRLHTRILLLHNTSMWWKVESSS